EREGGGGELDGRGGGGRPTAEGGSVGAPHSAPPRRLFGVPGNPASSRRSRRRPQPTGHRTGRNPPKMGPTPPSGEEGRRFAEALRRDRRIPSCWAPAFPRLSRSASRRFGRALPACERHCRAFGGFHEEILSKRRTFHRPEILAIQEGDQQPRCNP